MPKNLKPYYKTELATYQTEYTNGNLKSAWNHLERAHIIGQKYPYAHTFVHCKMLQFGIKIKSGKEVIGQIPRLIFGGIKSFVGKIPVGNPGGSNVPPLQPFPIKKELKDIFTKAGVTFS
ncbi:hypothetical protein GCM10022393_12330 [Aquimarina addita]|uniref:DUF3703 domain-containing protein n=2 Tax=Aquimarina addita TaxID=870485 RepID=A0ABP7XE71_9FLAO